MSGAAGNTTMRDDQAQLKQESLIFERGSAGRVGYTLPKLDVPATRLAGARDRLAESDAQLARSGKSLAFFFNRLIERRFFCRTA